MLSEPDFPKLSNFIACSFHQDWEEFADTYRGVVDARLVTLDAPTARLIADEVDALLASTVTEEELATWLDPIACVILEAEEYTPRSFVGMIAERIRAKHS
jgi:CdiI immunity protein